MALQPDENMLQDAELAPQHASIGCDLDPAPSGVSCAEAMGMLTLPREQELQCGWLLATDAVQGQMPTSETGRICMHMPDMNSMIIVWMLGARLLACVCCLLMLFADAGAG